MAASVATFIALFRHALIALGEPPPSPRREVLDRLAAKLGLDPAPVHAVLDLRDRKSRPAAAELSQMFASYLDALTRIAEEMDRRLAAEV